MEVNNVTFSYQDRVPQLHQLSTTIKKGRITTIIGPNGCGKSTFLSVLTNFNIPQHGQIILDGKELNKYKPKELAKKLGVVHQKNIAPEDMTVEKLVQYGRLPYKSAFTLPSEKDEEKVKWALTSTGLYEKRKELIDTLSGGQQQRAWIAMALAQDTPYLFLDEPTANLDIFFQYEILELVKKLCAEYSLTIVMILHDINQAIQYSDTIIAMKNGEIIKSGTPNTIITDQLIHDVYGIKVVVKEEENVGKYIIPIGI